MRALGEVPADVQQERRAEERRRLAEGEVEVLDFAGAGGEVALDRLPLRDRVAARAGDERAGGMDAALGVVRRDLAEHRRLQVAILVVVRRGGAGVAQRPRAPDI